MCLAMNKDMQVRCYKAIFWMHDKDNTGLMSTEDFGMKYASLRATAVTVSVSRGSMLAHVRANPH